MKKIRINAENREAIEAALAAVNGRSTSHTYSSLSNILGVASRAERQLAELPRISKANARGIIFHSVSGGSVAGSYKHPRNATSVKIALNAAGDWWLTDIEPATIWGSGGSEKLEISETHLTEMHAAILRRCTITPNASA